jgi:hypothetical protein
MDGSSGKNTIPYFCVRIRLHNIPIIYGNGGWTGGPCFEFVILHTTIRVVVEYSRLYSTRPRYVLYSNIQSLPQTTDQLIDR